MVVLSANWETLRKVTSNEKRGGQKRPSSTVSQDNEERKRMVKGNVNEVSGRYIPAVAIDAEFVGVLGSDGSEESSLGRVSIVNEWGNILLDEYVKPEGKVVDYRSAWSGLNYEILEKRGITMDETIIKVRKVMEDRVVVGHGLANDFSVMRVTIPPALVRDTALYKPLRGTGTVSQSIKKIPSLKKLAKFWLNEDIQSGTVGHSSIEDAVTAMKLYIIKRQAWEHQMFGAMGTFRSKYKQRVDGSKLSLLLNLPWENNFCIQHVKSAPPLIKGPTTTVATPKEAPIVIKSQETNTAANALLLPRGAGDAKLRKVLELVDLDDSNEDGKDDDEETSSESIDVKSEWQMMASKMLEFATKPTS